MFKNIKHTVKEGLIVGSVFYVASKLYYTLDSVANNYLPSMIPKELRKPLVGLILAEVTSKVSKGKIGKEFSEMFMVTAVADLITTAGAPVGKIGLPVGPGIIDAQVNKLLGPVATMGLPAGATNGYIMSGYSAPMAGKREGTRGYQMSGYASFM